MNVLFFLTPKIELEYVYDDFTVRQIMEKMNKHRYSVIPVLKENGEYLASISDGDLLRLIHDCNFNKKVAENIEFKEIPLYRPYEALSIDATIEELFEAATKQNFIPIVDDRNMFIGIVKRRDIILAAFKKVANGESKKKEK